MAPLPLRRLVRKQREMFGYDYRDWARITLYEACDRFIDQTIDRRTARVLAISSAYHFEDLGFFNFTATTYPLFDICSDTKLGIFDLIIADQVFEHIDDPEKGVKNVYAMLSHGGWFLITTPFMLRIHAHPMDGYRWTQTGLALMLTRAGFRKEAIETGQWGNRDWIASHMKYQDTWPVRGFGSLRNEPKFPVVVWAFACK
jgi:SAM-dependent methyltransferase